MGFVKVYDWCLYCGGNGSLCILLEDIYRKDYCKYGKGENIVDLWWMLVNVDNVCDWLDEICCFREWIVFSFLLFVIWKFGWVLIG